MSTTPEPDLQERARNLLFLAEPKRWSVWPFLPLVRHDPEGEMTCGVLCDLLGLHGIAGYRATVFLANLFLLPETLDELLSLPRETFDTPDEVYEAGWRID